MADVYQFSECSQELLKNCIAAARQPGKKWLELFKPEAKENNSFTDDEDTIILSVKSPNESVEAADPSEEIQAQIDETSKLNLNFEKLESVKNFGAILKETPSNKLQRLLKFSDYEILLPDLAQNLPIDCIEKICEEILESDIRTENKNIVLHFFPALIQGAPSYHNSLNLLVKTYKKYPETILSVIQSIFINIDVQEKLIGEFFIAVDEQGRSQFLQSISSTKLPPEVFFRHLTTISSLYNASEKTFEINNFVLNGLLQTAHLCQDDKNYGRFLLAFFQGLNANDQISRQSLEMLLDSHRTQFKRLCQNVLNKIDRK